MVKRSILMCCLLFGLFFQVRGESVVSDTTVLNLSFSDAVNLAVERNRTLQNASLDVKKAEASKWEAIASLLPQVNATADYSDLMGYEMDFGGMKIAMPAYAQLGVSAAVAVSASQIISTQLSQISIKMANIQQAQTIQEIANQVKVLYYSALVANETVDLLKKNVQSISQLYDFTQKSVDVGMAEQVDADQIMVQVATMKTSLSNAERSLEMVYNSMRLYLNIDVDAQINLTQGIDELLSIPNAMKLISQEFILENNYNFQLLQENTKLTKKQVDMAAWAYAPSVSVFYNYTTKKYFSDERTMNMTPPNMIGASISIPIFSSGRRYKALQGAKIAYQKQLNTLEDTEMSLKIQHRQLKYNLTSALERLETQKKNVEVTQRVFDNISKKYEFGFSSSMDVTTSGTNLITAQNNYVQALLDFVKAQIELEKLLNTHN